MPRKLPAQAKKKVRGAETCRLARFGEDGRVWVELAGESQAVPARRLLRLDRALRRAVFERREAWLVFEGGDRSKPVIVGLLQPGAARGPSRPAAAACVVETAADGARVQIQAQEQLVLDCGTASITLLRDGRIVIRGAEVHLDATEQSWIRGTQVRVN
jgi:hypothetical protein